MSRVTSLVSLGLSETSSDRAEIERLRRELDEANARLRDADLQLAATLEERRDVDAARRGVDAVYAAYIDNTPDGVFVVSIGPDGGITVETLNRVVMRALPLRGRDVRGMALGDVMPGEAAERLTAQIAGCLSSGKPLRYEETLTLPDGERVFEVTLTPVTIAGLPTRVVGAARDLTESRRAEQQLRQAQKMEVIGQLTGGVAHDFNNLLQVVKGNLDLLALELAASGASGLPPTVDARLRGAMEGAARGAKLTRQLLAFSRRQPLAPKSVAVYALVAAMSELLQRTLGETVEVEIAGDEPAWTALVDPTQLENAVLNLAINARDAMPEGGKLTIAVRNRLDPDDPAARWIDLSVTDSGHGMAPAVLGRVFEPFFSTKPEGRGTGLGLPQVQGFIEQSHGRMDIESAVGAGTMVRLSLPGSDTRPVEPEEPAPFDVRGRGERILVVEDDAAVRRAVGDLLLALGYEVATAATTVEAAALLEHAAPFDALLSDVVMPGSPSPPELARAARVARPRLKVLFMSGYAEDVIVHQGRIDADVQLIEKPYRKEELSLRLRRLLDESPPPAGPAEPAAPRRVLLVEDEPLIAMSLVDLLGSFGYGVSEARTAADAQRLFRDGPRVDLILSDLGLPDMDGEDLADWFRRERPGVPIVFSTGLGDFTPRPELVDGGPVRVVTKPFDSGTLRSALESCVS
ncbi:hybrid sensor histidine kinase/response regulator [Methylopila turkensis]|uniref:histidine kinase n=1 Tax=Methylopila turkensis TaxID=1437816 RepID=A0A9W6JNE6_9HYPH|nr:response regulator [Methylopila turkensis]GLK80302.1 hypothetical protein GCM10008174_20430 [Methylopila turkensis]